MKLTSWYIDGLLKSKYFYGILPKGPYPPCLRMADRALLAGYTRFVITGLDIVRGKSPYSKWAWPKRFVPMFDLPAYLGAIQKYDPVNKAYRANMGPVGRRWDPCWPHEPCYQGRSVANWRRRPTLQSTNQHAFCFGPLRLWQVNLYWNIMSRQMRKCYHMEPAYPPQILAWIVSSLM